MRKKLQYIKPSDLDGLSEDEQKVFFDEKMLEMATHMYGVDKREALSISFVAFLVFESEKKVEEGIKKVMKKTTSGGGNTKLLSSMMKELTFTGKLNVYEKMASTVRSKGKLLIKDISYFRQLNEIRNKLFHSKIKDILYKNKPIADIYTKLSMLQDYLKALGK